MSDPEDPRQDRNRPRLRDEPTMRRNVGIALVVSSAVFGIDRVTKLWAESSLDDRIITVVGPLQFALTYNTGIAFGLGGAFAPVLVVCALIGVIAVARGVAHELSRSATIGLGLVLGGAISNAFDRIASQRAGAVIDFIDFQFWPVFNVADVAIVVGAIVVAWWSLAHREAQ